MLGWYVKHVIVNIVYVLCNCVVFESCRVVGAVLVVCVFGGDMLWGCLVRVGAEVATSHVGVIGFSEGHVARWKGPRIESVTHKKRRHASKEATVFATGAGDCAKAGGRSGGIGGWCAFTARSVCR